MIQRIMTLLFCGIIITTVSSWLFTSFYGHIRSQDWISTTALVTNIEDSNKSATIAYKFIYNGSEYTGHNFSFLSGGSVPDRSHILSSYQVGDEIKIFVDPNNPQESVVLKRKIAFEHFSTHLFLIIMAILMGYFMGFRSKKT